MEYILLAALCSEGWRRGRLLEVARASTDAHGYDLILSEGGTTRHVQCKASVEGGRTAAQAIHLNLASRTGGCVIWMIEDAENLRLKRFGWFGGGLGAPLPPLGDREVRHTKGDSEGAKAVRPNLRRLPRGAFEWLEGVEAVFDRLFGAEPT